MDGRERGGGKMERDLSLSLFLSLPPSGSESRSERRIRVWVRGSASLQAEGRAFAK
jgi:hypothetical protein